MGKLLDFLKVTAGEASLHSKLGIWRQKISAEVDALISPSGGRTAGGISFYNVSTLALTGPFTLDTWFDLDPASFVEGALSSDIEVPITGRSLRYTGSAAKLLAVRAGLSLVATGAAVREDYELGIFRNGSLINASSAGLQTTVAQAGVFNAGHTTSQISVILQPNDVLDIRLRERAIGDTPTLLESAYLLIGE